MGTPTIVVAVDGAESSRAAVRWAARQGARDGRQLLLVHVLDWDGAGGRYDWGGRRFEAARRVAQEFVDRAEDDARTADPSILVDTKILVGDPAAHLVITSRPATLMVLGNRGHGGFAGLGLGSVSQRVATHAYCPVVVVRGRADAGEGPVAVGVDNAGTAGDVLAAGFAAAQSHGCSLLAVRSCVPVPSAYRTGPHNPDQDDTERARLQEQLAPWRTKFPDVPVEVLLSHDSPAAALNGVSRRCRLVVVGSRGHGVFAGALLGSTGLQLLHHADCPVLIVRPDDRKDARR
ncbi:universal stress protein [Actinoplanes sp. NPDC049802]|uniref:universal stress protein n=1 Tax=Actinoplanes sp. NPDC049802 TaxID=3154742 RepID=UPI0033F1EA9A